MLSLANDSKFKHPVHSYIFDTSDPVWDAYFTKAELKEAKNYNTKLRVDIPEEPQAYLSLFENKEFTAVSDYYDHALEHKSYLVDISTKNGYSVSFLRLKNCNFNSFSN